MVLIHGNDVKEYVSSIGEGTWGDLEVNADGTFPLRVASMKLMEGIVELGFNPQTRMVDVIGRMYSPPSHVRPYKVHTVSGFKIITQLKIDPKIFDFTRYQLGYMLLGISGKTEPLCLVFPEQIHMLDDSKLNVEVAVIAGRRVIFQPYAEFARLQFVAFPVGLPVDAVLREPVRKEGTLLTVEVPDDIDIELNKDIPIIKDEQFDDFTPDNVEVDSDEQ